MAFLIDSAILFIINYAIVDPLGLSLGTLTEDIDLVDLLVDPSYFTIGVSVWSTTIGKRVLGLYVMRADGSRVGPVRALARYLAYFLSVLLLCIGFIMVGVRRDKSGFA